VTLTGAEEGKIVKSSKVIIKREFTGRDLSNDEMLTAGEKVKMMIGFPEPTGKEEIDIIWYIKTKEGGVIYQEEAKAKDLSRSRKNYFAEIELPEGLKEENYIIGVLPKEGGQ